MLENTDTRLPLTSHDITSERMTQLRELFPEAFAEGVLDTAMLTQLIGQGAPTGPERFGLLWAGKAEALRAVQTLSTGTLRPAPDQSVDFETTGNLIIEGDNLEVLKLLQKSYHRRVKMIYIDPPYNTNNEFIYPDNFREGLQTYLEWTQQVKNGVRQNTNTETNGRYHSKWLSMMYPRLFLARNLLRDDGVIFVSIDDHEVHNLRLLMNDIYGEENFVAHIVWQKRYVSNATAKYLSDMHDHILVFARQKENLKVRLLERTEEQLKDYKNPDGDERGVWRTQDLSASKPYAAGLFTITGPSGIEFNPPPGRYWRCNEAQFFAWKDDNRIWFGQNGTGRPMLKAFLSEVQEGVTPNTWWTHDFAGHNKEATLEVKALFDGSSPFDTPKPVKLVKRMLELITDKDDMTLDFFAGSGTTAQAVMELNAEDGGNRKFILVQLPEVTGRQDFSTIADITRERVRRAAQKLNDAEQGRLPNLDATRHDRGFKAFTLDTSNFNVWDADAASGDGEKLAEQLLLYADHRVNGRSAQDVLYELLLKSGRSLTAPIVTHEVADQTVYDVDGGQLLVCLADPIDEATLRGMIALKPERVLCLDAAFNGNDHLKTNIVLTMRDAEIEFRTV